MYDTFTMKVNHVYDFLNMHFYSNCTYQFKDLNQKNTTNVITRLCCLVM